MWLLNFPALAEWNHCVPAASDLSSNPSWAWSLYGYSFASLSLSICCVVETAPRGTFFTNSKALSFNLLVSFPRNFILVSLSIIELCIRSYESCNCIILSSMSLVDWVTSLPPSLFSLLYLYTRVPRKLSVCLCSNKLIVPCWIQKVKILTPNDGI